MPTINGINYTFPGYDADTVGLLAQLSGDNAVSPSARAYYVLGNLLPYLSGSAFNSALTYLKNNAATAGENIFGGATGTQGDQWYTARNALAQLGQSGYRQPTPGLIAAQQQKATAANALTRLMNEFQAGSAANDPWGGEMSWLRDLSQLSSRQPKTASEWSEYNKDLTEAITPASSFDTDKNSYYNLLQWFANPSYNAPTVTASPGKSTMGGARSWWS